MQCADSIIVLFEPSDRSQPNLRNDKKYIERKIKDIQFVCIFINKLFFAIPNVQMPTLSRIYLHKNKNGCFMN